MKYNRDCLPGSLKESLISIAFCVSIKEGASSVDTFPFVALHD